MLKRNPVGRQKLGLSRDIVNIPEGFLKKIRDFYKIFDCKIKIKITNSITNKQFYLIKKLCSKRSFLNKP